MVELAKGANSAIVGAEIRVRFVTALPTDTTDLSTLLSEGHNRQPTDIWILPEIGPSEQQVDFGGAELRCLGETQAAERVGSNTGRCA